MAHKKSHDAGIYISDIKTSNEIIFSPGNKSCAVSKVEYIYLTKPKSGTPICFIAFIEICSAYI